MPQDGIRRHYVHFCGDCDYLSDHHLHVSQRIDGQQQDHRIQLAAGGREGRQIVLKHRLFHAGVFVE